MWSLVGITVQLLHFNNNKFLFLVKSNLVELEASRAVILPPRYLQVWCDKMIKFRTSYKFGSTYVHRMERAINKKLLIAENNLGPIICCLFPDVRFVTENVKLRRQSDVDTLAAIYTDMRR